VSTGDADAPGGLGAGRSALATAGADGATVIDGKGERSDAGVDGADEAVGSHPSTITAARRRAARMVRWSVIVCRCASAIAAAKYYKTPCLHAASSRR
jgi:hypothetical protein